MKIHIICTRLEADRIVPRLANLLAQGTNWTISEVPDETADLNYFFPYLELDNHKSFNATKIAAWFSHKDYAQPKKVTSWDNAAKRCDIRTTSAKKYFSELEKYGPTFIVSPPLDRNKFKPKP
jgi:hypothetical protein